MTGGRSSHEISLQDGRQAIAWLNLPETDRFPDHAIVIASGFGRKMHHAAGLNSYLNANGFAVVRYDPVDHIGLSDGKILDYTLTSAAHSLDAVLDALPGLLPGRKVGLIATSLSAFMAMATRITCRASNIEFLITISGVVDLRKTLHRVFDTDYSDRQIADLPSVVSFEGYEIKTPNFYRDVIENAWLNFDPKRDLAGCSVPVTAFVGELDDWVELQDVANLSSALQSYEVHAIGGCGHDMARNASAARKLAIDIAKRCRRYCGDAGSQFVEPLYADIMKAAIHERRLERSTLGADRQ